MVKELELNFSGNMIIFSDDECKVEIDTFLKFLEKVEEKYKDAEIKVKINF